MLISNVYIWQLTDPSVLTFIQINGFHWQKRQKLTSLYLIIVNENIKISEIKWLHMIYKIILISFKPDFTRHSVHICRIFVLSVDAWSFVVGDERALLDRICHYLRCVCSFYTHKITFILGNKMQVVYLFQYRHSIIYYFSLPTQILSRGLHIFQAQSYENWLFENLINVRYWLGTIQ